MIKRLGKYERRTLLLFLLILTSFIVIGSSVIYVKERHDRMRQATLYAEREIELIGKLITEALIKSDYSTVEQFIGQWTRERPDLVEVKLTTANGFVLARYVRTQPAQYRLPLRRLLAYGDQGSVTVDMVWDMATVHQSLNRLLVILAALPTVLVALLLLFLWRVLRRTLLLPLYSELEERERYLSLTLDSIGDAVIATDVGGYITRMNPVAETLTGWHASEVAGRPLPEVFRIINAQTREPVADPVEKVLRTGRIISLANHTALISKDGAEYQIDDSGAPITDNDGNLLGIVLVFHDITGRKQAEDELRKHRDHLEELVNERTAELRSAQQELLRKQRLAAIGQLTATVSHELRNPLGSIRNSLAVIRRLAGKDNPMMKNALEITERGVSRCDNIITELLDFTRVREIKLEPTDLDAWLGEVLDAYKHTPEIELVREPGAGVEIHCDRERLLRAALNVLNNACDAVTEEGLQYPARTPRVVVTTRIVDDSVEIEIADNGPGMSAEQLEKVFEPLFSTKSFGVGLGLPVVKQIMEQHGGSVYIDSKPGQGARVRLLLPLRKQEVTE